MGWMVIDPRIIIPLDFADAKEAMVLIARLDPALCRVKVGKELFTRAGPAFVEQIIKKDFDVFLDLKFHDIPNTVANACSAAADLGVWMCNVHTSGGERMLTAAREAIDRSTHKPLLIAVTVLTSMTDEDLKQVGIEKTVDEEVMVLTQLAHRCKLDGVVCSAHEVSAIKKKFGKEFKLVTPGIRPAGSIQDDQRRVMTPAEAIQAGSDYLVIGRPITRAPDPLQVLMTIDEEIRQLISN